MKKKIFHTDNGEEVFPLKTYDGSLVPLGYFYEDDFYDRLKIFQNQLTNSVFPIIKRLVESEIPNNFNLSDKGISIEIFGSNLKNVINENPLTHAFEKVISELEFLNTHNTDLYFNIEFKARENRILKKYGCQVKANIGAETVQDLNIENDYSVWYIYLGNEKTIIETSFTPEQENKIINHFLNSLDEGEIEIPELEFTMDLQEYKLLMELNTYHTKALVAKVVYDLQKLKGDGYVLSGENSGLKNVWDEICVQIQGEYSFHWEAYESTIFNYIKEHFDNLPDAVKRLINYMSLNDELDEMDDSSGIREVFNQVLSKASDHTNVRIRTYLDY